MSNTSKRVFITGATSGIGKATAMIYAKNGYDLIITGRRSERLKSIATDLTDKFCTGVTPLSFDLRNFSECEEKINELDLDKNPINILINNAGLAKGFAPIQEGSIAHWDQMIDTNIKGLLYITRLISPSMVSRNRGHIINICSTAGKEVYPNGNVYCASKYAVDALTKSMRIDLHKHNIRVSQVAPGHVEETEFAEVRFDGDKEKAKIYNEFVPLNSTDVAETIYFISTRPDHVNIQDVLMMGTQQASSNFIDKSGR